MEYVVNVLILSVTNWILLTIVFILSRFRAFDIPKSTHLCDIRVFRFSHSLQNPDF